MRIEAAKRDQEIGVVAPVEAKRHIAGKLEGEQIGTPGKREETQNETER